jgi:hypothetical protein
MITRFSVVALCARLATLALAFAFVQAGAGGRPARADEPAPPAPEAPKSDKARAKQELSEARLAAARAAAGSGKKGVDARALYGQALAAGLAAVGQAAADAEAPRPSSTTSVANEQPGGDEPAAAPEPPVAAAPEDEAAARARAAQEQEQKQENAERVARERADAAAAETKRREEAEALRRAAAPVAAPVVVAVAPPPRAPSPPLAFQIGERSAFAAKDSAGGHHVSGGLVFTWLTFATTRGRGTVVVDLESTRFRAGRNDTMDRAQVAFDGLGFDWTVPFASRGTGLFVGAEAAAGVLQSSTAMSSVVQTDSVLQLMPHVGGAVSLGAVGLFADAGWRFAVLAGSGAGSVGGLVAQGGLRVEMNPGEAPAPGAFEVGYAARFYAPNGSAIYKNYGGLPGSSGSGPLLEHELFVTTKAGLPARADAGLAVTYLGADRADSGAGLHVAGLGVLGTWHAFATHQLVNPYLGLRLGVEYISNQDSATFEYAKQVGLLGAGAAGIDVGLHRRVALRLGVAYDVVAYSTNQPNASLSGYAVEAGVLVRP